MAQIETLIIGAGLAGLRALYALRQKRISATVLEASDEIGGVWNHNRYPGARCDVESFDYSYSFSEELEQEWRWTERYPTQPEILRYINHVADRFDLREDILLNTRVDKAVYDEDCATWTVTAEDGRVWTANVLMLCLGQLSAPKIPAYEGQDSFKGKLIVSATWPKEKIDFTGKRVGIIGTGSSGMQMTPVVAETAKHLTVFQRTANYSLPAANAPLSDEEVSAVKANYAARRDQIRNSPSGLGFQPGKVKTLEVSDEEREAALEKSYHRLGFGFALTFPDILLNVEANAVASDFLKRKMAERIADPELKKKLVPNDHGFGTRRPSVDGGYFEAFARDNVSLADIREHPIVEFTPEGIRTDDKLHELDIVIFATGFDAITGALLKPRIVGRGGQTLAEKWEGGPLTQLGLATAGFPNMVMVAGPGSPSVLSNVIVSIEEQADWYAEMLASMKADVIVEFEATETAEQAWTDYVQERARETLYGTANSFYNGGEVAGKPRVFMPYSGGVRHYRLKLIECADAKYAGFEQRKTPLAQNADMTANG